MAHAAVEMAALDIDLHHRKRSIVEQLADVFGPARSHVEWCAVLGLHATIDDVDDAVRSGAAQVKLKVGPSRDLSHVEAARQRYPELKLAVDANGSYKTLDEVPERFGELALAYVEQPVAPDDLLGAAAVAERLGVRVALDESITSAALLRQALEVGACTVVSVKPARLGGVAEATQTMEVAQQGDIDAFVGGMLETGIGRAVALGLAAQRPCTLPCDAGPTSRYFTRDIAPAFEPDANGGLHASTVVGIGAVPDPVALAQHRVERVTLRA